MSYKIGVIGERESVLPFQMMGWEVSFCETAREARGALAQMISGNCGVIYLTTSLAADMMEIVEHYNSMMTPVITLIPSHKGRSNLAEKRLADTVIKAIGKNIL